MDLIQPHISPGISFTPREVGEHLVNVFRNGKHIPNSPFKIYVGESEIGNANKVKVFGKGLTEGMANELNEFTVNTKEAGEFFMNNGYVFIGRTMVLFITL